MAKLFFTATCCVVLVALAAPLSFAQDSQSIFNGKNLSGWKVDGAKARARDGVMTLERAKGWVYYEKTPAHFVLTMDVRLLHKDSQVALVTGGVPNGDKKNTIPTYAPRIVLGPVSSARAEQLPAWHRVEVESVGFSVRAKLDGAPVYTLDDAIGRSGDFGLAAIEGSAEFQNIQLKEVTLDGPIANRDGIYLASKAIVNPAVLSRVDAVYPRGAAAARLEGEVWVAATVLASGVVGHVRIVRSVPGLDQAALDAAKQWTFNPATLDGKPVGVVITIAIEFSLGR